MVEKMLVPPDGGWGWMVVLGAAIIHMIAIPIAKCFELIFAERFKSLGLSATDMSVLMNANAAFGMCLGFINSPLLRLAGCRRVGLAGGVLFSIGVMLSAAATSFAELLMTYGLIMSLGAMLLMSSFSTAVNLYFREKLSRATSITVTLAALGPIFFPYFITGLMSRYGVFGCVLILGAISTHMIMAALLLQPVEWHMKKISTTKVTNKTYHNTGTLLPESNNSEMTRDNEQQNINDKMTYAQPSQNRILTAISEIAKFLDLDILKDRAVMKVILLMIVTIFIEINFNQMMPFILSDLAFSKNDIATFLTLMSAVDIVGRVSSPFAEEYLKLGNLNMFFGGIGCMVFVRIGLLYAETYYQVLLIGGIIGLIKGFSTVYMHLILPSCLPVEKLPAAGGVIMLGSGLFLMTFGPMMGMLRDYTGSYTQGIMALNGLSLCIMISWILGAARTKMIPNANNRKLE